MFKHIHLRLTDEINDGIYMWQVYFCTLQNAYNSTMTFSLAVRHDTTFEQLALALQSRYDVPHVLVQDAMFVRLGRGSMIGADKVIGTDYINWKKT
jgi:hypothetical protein